MRRILILAACLAQLLLADTKYMIDYLLPRGGQRGTTVQVAFHGIELDNPREILFYEPGIKASHLLPPEKPGDGFRVLFEIAPDCALGEHVLRVRTTSALSDAVTFWVGPFPTVHESETKVGENDTLAKAQQIPLNVTVEGQIQAGDDHDIDIYRVEMERGQRLSVEVEAARLGTLHYGGESDLVVRIRDAAGKEIARNDDSALYVQDPVLSIMVPEAGTYYIELRQQIFSASKQAWYRAHIGTFSRPAAIFPAGGKAGSVIEARILGDPAGERTETIALPAQPGNMAYFAGAEGEKPPSPNILRVSPYPNVVWEGETVTTKLPVALNGILARPGESHTYAFSAKKGEAWRVRVYSRTLGAPVDARIWIRSAKDPKHLVDADDTKLADLGYPSSRGTWYIKDQQDPAVVFQPPADGDYILGIEDTTGAGGPDHVYRVEIDPLLDTVYTHITSGDAYQLPRLTGLIVPQGNRWTLDVQLASGLGNRYKGAIRLEAEGLPQGVTMIAPPFAAGVTRMPVQFIAAPDAKPQTTLIRLLAVPQDPKAQLASGSRQGFGLLNQPGEVPWHFVFLDRFAFAVTEPAPFHIELEQPKTALVQNGELLLKAKIIRHGDFKDAVEIVPDWLPPGVSKAGVVTIGEEESEGTFRIQANDKAAPGVYKVAMNASTTSGDSYSGVGRVRASSAFIELKVAEPYLTIDLNRGAVERGGTATLTGVLHQKNAFPGEASVILQHLPPGITMMEPAPHITAKDTEVTFRVQASPDALAGLYKGLSCEVAFSFDGQTIRQQTGSGILRVDAPRGAAIAVREAGK